jgi:hypothetical protein
MDHEDLPERWLARLKDYLTEKSIKDRAHLLVDDFPTNQSVRVLFEDGSTSFFHYAFYILDQELREVAVFTEHCGYHIFPLGQTELQVLQTTWTDVGV